MNLADAIRDFQLIPPIDPALAQPRDLAERRAHLAGAHVALLDNRKGNADVLLTEIGAELQRRHAAADATLFTKPIFSRPSPDALIDEVAGYDVAVAAIGD